jgi:hypothetical protein
MGQYYKVIILAEKADKTEIIRLSVNPSNYLMGMKLMEHSYIDNNFLNAVEYIISPEGMFYKSRIVWAGDYANNEDDSNKNLYKMTKEESYFPEPSKNKFKYIINHTKKEYVDKTNQTIHPLALLTAEGNGRGGGDYIGSYIHLVGKWARDIISVNNQVPEGYEEIKSIFSEN